MKTLITVKTDAKVKKKAAALAAKLGLSLSDIINVSLAQFVQTKSLKVGEEEKPGAALQKLIARADAEMKAGQTSPVFDTPEKALKYLGL